jgi:hypothetical protein
VKNHEFTPKNHIFSNFRGGAHAPLPWIRPWCMRGDSRIISLTHWMEMPPWTIENCCVQIHLRIDLKFFFGSWRNKLKNVVHTGAGYARVCTTFLSLFRMNRTKNCDKSL